MSEDGEAQAARQQKTGRASPEAGAASAGPSVTGPECCKDSVEPQRGWGVLGDTIRFALPRSQGGTWVARPRTT